MALLKSIGLSLLAVFAPVQAILLSVGFLIIVDLILGITAALKRGETITSSAMRRTVSKLLVYELAVMSGFICETYLMSGIAPISKLVAGVIGMVEIKSIFENCDSIYGEPILKKLIKKLGSDNDKDK